MNKQKIALRYTNSVFTPQASAADFSNGMLVASINAELMRNGFILSQKASAELSKFSDVHLTDMYNTVLTEVRAMVGADVDYQPMYPNFPEQVMNASLLELFMNAVIHYWSSGTWKPEYDKLPREIQFEKTEFKELGLIFNDGLNDVFTSILSSNDSISDADRKTIKFFINNVEGLTYPAIPFKENMCYVAGLLAGKGRDISVVPKTATDVLRIATALSGGDVSLAENTKFKSFPRAQRRMLASALYNVANLDDFMRHRNKWVRLFHSLHINELTNSVSLVEMVKKVRSGERAVTFNSVVEGFLKSTNVTGAVLRLKTRPGDFARRLGHVLGLKVKGRAHVVEEFLSVADQVSTRVLLQLLGSLKVRGGSGVDKRVVFPKGSIAKAQVIRTPLPKLGARIVKSLQEGINAILVSRFSNLESLGKVYIDPELQGCPLPAAQRSAAEGLIQVARGTRMPFGNDKNTLRFFIYWVGQDIDLSATLHDENFENIGHVSYTDLRNDKYKSYHSGDIVQAPNGACEFIDITIDGAVKAGARYVAMNVLVYAGPNFSEHEKCYAGWMTRSKPQSNEVFDAKTVEQKVDLRSECRNAMVVVFDLVDRKAIWTDLVTPKSVRYGGNNVESNRASIEEKLEAIVSLDNKTTLEDLFLLHAEARATEIVEDPTEADTVFGMAKGIGPRNITEINAEFLVDGATTKKEKV
ncbi:TerD family protein [Candidatus Pacearchaeota archaeon]|nr:TerD family protein [Candidatus Pacearchaeota archaeon]